MKVIMLSRDLQALDPASSVSARIQEYRNLTEDLVVFVFNPKGNKLWGLWQFYRLVKKGTQEEARKGSKDMLITAQDPFELGLVAYLSKRKYNLALQLQIHTDLFSPFFVQESILNKIRVQIAKLILPKADGIRVVSQRIRDSVMNKLRIREDSITVLPIFTDITLYKDIVKTQRNDEFVFLTVARLSREKNIGLAIRALVEVVKKHSKAKMIIVGDGPERASLQSLADRLQVSSHVSFPGAGWKTGLVQYFAAADSFLLVSNYEGYAMAVVEAMGAGLPVIMTDVGLAGWIMKDKQQGVVIPVGGKDALVSAMLHMIEDEQARVCYGQAAHQIALQLLSKSEYLVQYKKAWEKCLHE